MRKTPHLFFLGGIDEAGRGPLAGPVTAAAVVLSPRHAVEGLRDSKKLNESQREALAREIKKTALSFAVVSVGPRRIEFWNIRRATQFAMSLAAQHAARELRKLCSDARAYFLVDGNMNIASVVHHEPVIRGDDCIQAVSAASILAKVQRDSIMKMLDRRYPNYGFAEHKGYPTCEHRLQLQRFGPCAIHRRTFAGVREMLAAEQLEWITVEQETHW